MISLNDAKSKLRVKILMFRYGLRLGGAIKGLAMDFGFAWREIRALPPELIEVYDIFVEIAKKRGTPIPKPKVEMRIEGELE